MTVKNVYRSNDLVKDSNNWRINIRIVRVSNIKITDWSIYLFKETPSDIILPSKCENLSRSNTCLQKTTAIKYSLRIYNIHIFAILGVVFEVPFLNCFQKLQLLVAKKKNWNNNFCIVILFVWAQEVVSDF